LKPGGKCIFDVEWSSEGERPVLISMSDLTEGKGTGSEKALKVVGFAPALECGERVASDSSDVAVDA
jgi:hypothetical protein